MLKLERIHYVPARWAEILCSYPSHMLGQTPQWLAFVQEAQQGEVVLAEVKDSARVVGHFCGIMVRRFGLRLLGSPLPGWTTSYMGFCLDETISRAEAVTALHDFAFSELGCVHLELMDRDATARDTALAGSASRSYTTYEIDLSLDEAELFGNLSSACRRCIRKAIRSGVRIEESDDPSFAAEYFEQLRDVFAKQRLTPTYGLPRVQALIRHLRPTENVLCLRARDAQGRCIATGIFPGANQRAYFWGGASWRRYQIVRPNELLMWHAILGWKRRGVRYLDLGGSGEYKRKYGGTQLTVPWMRASRYPGLSLLRQAAVSSVRARQRWNALVQAAIAIPHRTSKSSSW